MKKLLLPLFAVLFFALVFVSCREDRYTFDYQWIDIATVENPDQRSAFYFRLDDNTLMFTAASNLHNFYHPKDGHRIIANYTILNNKSANSPYDHDVRLNNVYDVLTKEIFDITPAAQDSIGNDPIFIHDIWIGRDFLNIEFEYRGLHKIHFINLVSDDSKVYNDGKVHLEFRHNAYEDEATYRRKGIVSFNLASLQEGVSGTNNLELVIHVKESDSVQRAYELNYKFADSTSGRYRLKDKSAVQQYGADIN